MTTRSPWKIVELDEVSSTNTVAREHPAWRVIVSRRQTDGRGRFGRSWRSDVGGLWFSAVLPAPSSRTAAELSAFSLCAALGLVKWLRLQHIDARVRWPNDILIGPRKLAGLLGELLLPERMIVGIGMNVNNNLGDLPHDLETPATRLADCCQAPDSPVDLLPGILDLIHAEWSRFSDEGFSPARLELNAAWHAGRTVEAESGKRRLLGLFVGVDENGWPILRMSEGGWLTLPAPEIQRLRELE